MRKAPFLWESKNPFFWRGQKKAGLDTTPVPGVSRFFKRFCNRKTKESVPKPPFCVVAKFALLRRFSNVIRPFVLRILRQMIAILHPLRGDGENVKNRFLLSAPKERVLGLPKKRRFSHRRKYRQIHPAPET